MRTKSILCSILAATYLSGCSTAPIARQDTDSTPSRIVAGDLVKLATTHGETYTFRVEFANSLRTCSPDRCFAAAEIENVERVAATEPPASNEDTAKAAAAAVAKGVLVLALITLLVASVAVRVPMMPGPMGFAR